MTLTRASAVEWRRQKPDGVAEGRRGHHEAADGKLSAHYENTVLITDGEPEILTVTEGL